MDNSNEKAREYAAKQWPFWIDSEPFRNCESDYLAGYSDASQEITNLLQVKEALELNSKLWKDDYEKAKADASQQCAELQKEVERLKSCVSFSNADAQNVRLKNDSLQSENESLKKRVSKLEYTLRQARGLTNYIPVELEHHAKNIEKAIELALNPLS